MIRAAALLMIVSVSALASQEPSADAAAEAALKKLSERLKEARTLSAKVVQSRRTDLLDKPIVSSGTMYYRRDPARLVFHLTEPRKAEIHMDRTSYQVYRPDEQRVERTEFGGEDVSGKILMVFEPRSEQIGKAFAVRGGASRDGQIEVRLEPLDEKVRRRLRKVALSIVEADGALRRMTYVDGDGDEVTFDLSEVAINPELPAGLFTLTTPEGTRVIRRVVAADK